MKGRVDDYGRALVPVTFRNPITGVPLEIETWIDTGFTGAVLLLLRDQVTALQLPSAGTVLASLADGSQTTYDSFLCEVDWFGKRLLHEAMAATGKFALVGVRLMEDLQVMINYPARTVELIVSPDAHLPPPVS